jgi:hypothetical protein
MIGTRQIIGQCRTTTSLVEKFLLELQCLSCRRAATAKPSDMTTPLAHGSPAASA